MSPPSPVPGDGVQLIPKRPPGRSTRKARGFIPQILTLRSQGYTLEAIREALAEAGVVVSKSTVQREAAMHRVAPRMGAENFSGSFGSCAPVVQGTEMREAVEPALNAADGEPEPTRACLGRDVAKEFMKSRITNPLARARHQPKEST